MTEIDRSDIKVKVTMELTIPYCDSRSDADYAVVTEIHGLTHGYLDIEAVFKDTQLTYEVVEKA